jgi:ArsR family transcriptional regulator
MCRYDWGHMKPLVSFGKAFADPNRVRVLAALREGELCVCELADALELTQSTLSTHLQVLREGGLVQSRRQGKWIYYAMAPGFGKVAEGLFRFFEKDLEEDGQIKADGKRLARRLAEREDGQCCRGFSKSC